MKLNSFFPPSPSVFRYAYAVFAACIGSSLTQRAVSAEDEPTRLQDDEVITLPLFEATSTQGAGYVSNNSVTGFKTRQKLIDIPQAITVVTSDLVDDIGLMHTSDILQYVGVSNFFRGESLAVRGARINNALIDEMPVSAPFMDNFFIDSFEVIRGPAAVLYRSNSLGGVVLKNTKKPLTNARREVTFELDQHGTYRGQLDLTGPMGLSDNLKLGYRLIAAYEDGDGFFSNIDGRLLAVHPSFQLQYNDTIVRVALDYQEMTHVAGSNVLAPDGSLFIGAGRRETYVAPNGMEDFDFLNLRVAMLHQFSPSWEMKLQATRLEFSRLGGVLLRRNMDWNTRTIAFAARKNDQNAENWALQGDFLGHYRIGSVESQSAFGFSIHDGLLYSRFISSSAFGTQPRSVDNPRMDEIVVPQPSDYTGPFANPGRRTKATGGDVYYQQTLNLLNDRLVLVGGVTQSWSETNNRPNLNVPNTSTVLVGDDLLHRLGIVFRFREDFVIYAMQSTTANPSNSRGEDGNLLGSQEGEANEIGLKAAFLNGRISGTLAFFDIELSNVGVFGGITPGGVSFQVPIGSTTQKGFDFDLAFSLTPAWQVITTGFKGKVRGTDGALVSGSYESMWSVFTRYDFPDGALKGWAIGGGATRTGDRIVATRNFITFPPGEEKSFMELESDWMATAFVNYSTGAWTFLLNVENALDVAIPVGAQTPVHVDPSPPRTISASIGYRF